MTPLTIAIIGGTGKSGQFVVQQLLQQSYQLKFFPRPAGDVRDFDTVSAFIKGCQVVVSTLGQPKGQPSIFSDATRNILQAMKLHHVSRYIVTTGLSVNTPLDHKNEKVQLATSWMYDNYPETTRDKQKEYELLTESEADWTLIRLPLIQQTAEAYGYHTRLDDCTGNGISATDLGQFIVQEIAAPQFIRAAPFLYNQ